MKRSFTTVLLFWVVITTFFITACAQDSNEKEEDAKGYMTNNNVCTQDEYEQTLFGQEISIERNGEIRLGIKCTHDIYADLTIYRAQDGKYVPDWDYMKQFIMSLPYKDD